MNMPMIRNRNGDGSARPAPSTHSTSRGAAISAEPGGRRQPADRHRRRRQRVRLQGRSDRRRSRRPTSRRLPLRGDRRRTADRASRCCSGGRETESEGVAAVVVAVLDRARRREEPRLEVVVEHAVRVRQAGGEQRLARQVERSQRIHPGVVADEQLGRWPTARPPPRRGRRSRSRTSSAFRGTGTSSRPRRCAAGPSGPCGRSTVIRMHSLPSRSYWLDIVWSSTRKSRLAWCLGMPQMPLPPLTEISELTGRSQTYWPVPACFMRTTEPSRLRGLAPMVQARAMLYST